MNFQMVNIGSAPNAKDGDTARAAFRKVNENFAKIFGSADAIIVNQTADFNAQGFTTYLVDTTLSTVTATLPSTPSIGDVIVFIDSSGNFAVNNFIVNLNGNKLRGSVAATVTYDTAFEYKEYLFANTAVGWIER